MSTNHQLGILEPVISKYNNVRLVTARDIRDKRLVGCIFDIIIVDDYWFSANFINEKRFYQFFDGITYIKSYNKDEKSFDIDEFTKAIIDIRKDTSAKTIADNGDINTYFDSR